MSLPAPAGAQVAVLERRGRFVVAAPLFPEPLPEHPRRRDHSGSITVRPGGSQARVGDLVLVLGPRRGGAGRILRRLGRPEVARDLLQGLMFDRGLRGGFEPAVEEEAREAARRVQSEREERRDLRDLATFTVDPVSARDFDDAISAEREASGRIRVWVHIADVAAHVAPGSLVDREARRRATSVYVPGLVEPMLPHVLSSDACSLRPGLERAAVTVELELEGARVLASSFYRSLIRSDERLDYEQLDRIFAGEQSPGGVWAQPLAVAREAAAALARERARHGALVLDAPEPEVAFDDAGNVSSISARVQTESHRLIEALMVAANEAVAEMLSRRKLPCLYRVHEPPEPQRVERLADQLASLEVPTPPMPEPLSRTQAAALLGEISQRIEQHLRRQQGRGRIALSRLLLRSLQQAYYSPSNLGHAGLRSSAYCHFTSPIRRYPDLICHRALLSAIGASEQAPPASELGELGVWTSERERAAMVIERDADRMASCFALLGELQKARQEASFAGEVTGLISAGAFVAFSVARAAGQAAPPYEGMLPVRRLALPANGQPKRGQRGARSGPAGRPGGEQERREWWELNEQGTVLHGERSGAVVRLGDALQVRVGRVDTVRGRVDLEPAG